MLTKIKNIFIVLLLVLVITQFLRPEKNEGSYDSIASFEEATGVSAEVKTILQNNCYDCHSNTTRYPWYMQVSPVSHWMAYHIEEGKEHFSVSEWEFYTDKQKDRKLEELIEEVEGKEMPLQSYTWIHGELPNQDAEKLMSWAKELREKQKEVKKDTLDPKEPNTAETDSLSTDDSAQ